ncbi:hypothetical protein G6M89_05905 [Natronolimnobius sp. AArcel1]|uniref:hypothetical protein n=1 Tax=Natronolimnobius sp. AArcel1 TaxID=1679093 RepID=UPI0013ED26F7|nr:hypothetical protein [Natronolimnobius sp. AArcel1]NGM68550.1 hypothetical protein [Natronolimnobius sp. AArcel1]
MSEHDGQSEGATSTESVADGGVAQESQQPVTETPDESVTDIINKESTKTQLMVIVGVFAGVGIGMGITGYFTFDMFASGEEGVDAMTGAIIGIAAFMGVAIATPILGALLAVRASSVLQSEPDNQVFATVGAGAFVGHVLAFILASFIITQQLGEGSGFEFGEMIVDTVLAAVGAALASVVAVYLVRNQE